ncbi:MAG: hypothetical protein ACTSRA_13205 [Promethearchaeota archaeon]
MAKTPDWVAHLMFGYILSVIFKFKNAKRVTFLLGNLLPDVLRFLLIITDYLNQDFLTKFITQPVNEATHSIIGIIAMSALTSIFFESDLSPQGNYESISNNNPPVRISIAHGTKRVHLYRLKMSWNKLMNKPFYLLLLGSSFHLFLDMFMWPWVGVMKLFYPFIDANFSFSFKLLWPTTFTAIAFLTPFTCVFLIIEIYLRFFKMKKKPGTQVMNAPSPRI